MFESIGRLTLGVVAFGCLITSVWHSVAVRDAIIYPEPATVTVTDAKPGQTIKLTGQTTKLREECVIDTIGSLTVIRHVETTEEWVVNQRSGIRTRSPEGTFDISVLIEVPRFAIPGRSVLYFETVYDCGTPWPVTHRTPDYPFTVLEAANG